MTKEFWEDIAAGIAFIALLASIYGLMAFIALAYTN